MSKYKSKHNFEYKYRKLLKKIYKNGINKKGRTKEDFFSLFSRNIKFDVSNGKMPMITGRRIYQKIFKTEFDWFINGETNIKRFQDNNITIWGSWADKNGELGKGIYGDSMINWNDKKINQLNNVIESIKNKPNSRRHKITLWNPSFIEKQNLPPCYHDFQFFIDENKHEISMHVLQRSADMFLGIPYDVCVFTLLLYYVACKTSYNPSVISLTMVDCHIYSNQLKAVSEYLATKTYEQPIFKHVTNTKDLKITNYYFDSHITAEVSI